VFLTWWAALLLFQPPVAIELPNVAKNPHTTPADLDLGKRLFAGRCAGCHGPNGDGGKGANLGVPVLPRAAEDLSLYKIIRYGIPETEMPPSFMTPKEVWQVAAFVRTLGQVRREALAGDAARGERLVRGKGGCLQCHVLGLEGGLMGPPLTDIGSRRSAAHLRGKLVDPASDIPDQFRLVEMTPRGGSRISGIRLNEDSWTIQVRDFSGSFHSYAKQDLASLKIEKRTPMPSYRSRLDPAELNDVVAYLSGLRGEQ
jgi:putative heme-binding domain-containing protein